MAPPIVITGLGIVSPFGTSLESFRDALVAGRTAVAPLTAFEIEACRARCAAAVAGFDPTRWIPVLKLRRMDITGQYAIATARQALDAAAFAYGTTPDDGVGVVVGTYTAGGAPTEEFLKALFAQGPLGAPALIFNATVANIAASLVGLELKLRGPNATISHKEASGLAAIAHAADLLRSGQGRIMIGAGIDALYPLFYKVHDRFRVLSRANGRAEGSRPFDVSRNGFVLGEGGFAVVLETADSAHARGASIQAELLATASGGATVGINQWPDRPAPIARVMSAALREAGLQPAEVDVVYASANSTVTLDAVEAAALRELFGGGRTIVTSIKGAIGESGAAGAAACVAAIACGRAGVVPPIAGLHEPDASCAGLRLAREAAPSPGRIALVNAIASGGALVSAVLRIAG